MISYYLWRGVDAIEDLDDCDNDEVALRVLRAKTCGNWTLWRRDGTEAKLLGVKCDVEETHIYQTAAMHPKLDPYAYKLNKSAFDKVKVTVELEPSLYNFTWEGSREQAYFLANGCEIHGVKEPEGVFGPVVSATVDYGQLEMICDWYFVRRVDLEK